MPTSPGPWKVTPPYGAPGGEETRTVFASDGFGVCLVSGDNREANARLIAAAPEMLSLLREFTDNMEHALGAREAATPDSVTGRARALLARIDGGGRG
jgi:hypothetical protein